MMYHPDTIGELLRTNSEDRLREADRARLGRRAKSPRRPVPRPEPTER